MSISLRLASPHELAIARAIDEDASALYAEVGIHLVLPVDHPFARAEQACWRAAIAARELWFAVNEADEPLGFIACGALDGAPYLDQISVRRASMRQGVGRLLLAQAIRWSAPHALWLTTYAHVPWNRPYYERAGFAVVPEAEHGVELRAVLAEQRRTLPFPAERVAMRHPHTLEGLGTRGE